MRRIVIGSAERCACRFDRWRIETHPLSRRSFELIGFLQSSRAIGSPHTRTDLRHPKRASFPLSPTDDTP
jgi:hypothetical protein